MNCQSLFSRKNIKYITDTVKTSDIHDRCLRSSDNNELRVPFSKTRYYENSFSVNGAKLWNSLPTNIKQISNINSFKNAVRSYLMNSN